MRPRMKSSSTHVQILSRLRLSQRVFSTSCITNTMPVLVSTSLCRVCTHIIIAATSEKFVWEDGTLFDGYSCYFIGHIKWRTTTLSIVSGWQEHDYPWLRRDYRCSNAADLRMTIVFRLIGGDVVATHGLSSGYSGNYGISAVQSTIRRLHRQLLYASKSFLTVLSCETSWINHFSRITSSNDGWDWF
jgi:hypothetical protein